jgi:DNA-binding helix-hairpin-helix protein with protein kinase domain
MKTLKPGDSLRCLETGLPCRIDELIGEGGQGEVYRVSLNGRPCALKWYNDFVLRVDRRLRERLQVAIDIGAPSAQFLWPFELVSQPDGARLGYLMRLRNPAYLKIHSLLTQQVRPSFRVLAMVCCQLADALLALHAKGLNYQDLNAGNVFFDPDTGAIEICDNDNVDIDGAPSVMGGVWEFQAPEIVLRQAGPSRTTDLYSLAVMLFRILHVGHPLVGKRELAFPNLSDPAAMRRLFGSEARFVFDPMDESNRPLPDRHGPVLGHWAIYPEFLRKLFVRAFTEGLYDPQHGRVQETEWRRGMRQLLDSVQTCPDCSAQNFYDNARLAARRETYPCWHCGRGLACAPSRIGLRRAPARPDDAPIHVVVLEPGASLFAHHLGHGSQVPDSIAAEVPRDSGLVLVNRSASDWSVVDAAGATASIGPGARLGLATGQKIRFGAFEASVRMSP